MSVALYSRIVSTIRTSTGNCKILLETGAGFELTSRDVMLFPYCIPGNTILIDGEHEGRKQAFVFRGSPGFRTLCTQFLLDDTLIFK